MRPVATPATAPAPGPSAPAGFYQVQPHEGVYAIARRYNLRPADLLAWNQLPPNAGLAVGQSLRLSPPPTTGAPAAAATSQPQPPAAPAASAPSATVWHAVLIGETLYSLAHRYGVTVADLQAWNKKPDASVRLGEVLRMNAPPTH